MVDAKVIQSMIVAFISRLLQQKVDTKCGFTLF